MEKIAILYLIFILISCNSKDQRIIIYKIDEGASFPIAIKCSTILKAPFLGKSDVRNQENYDYIEQNSDFLEYLDSIYLNSNNEVRYKVIIGSESYCFDKYKLTSMETISFVNILDSIMEVEGIEILNVPHIPGTMNN